MLPVPIAAEPLLMDLGSSCTDPTLKRMLVLLVGAILARRRRTVLGLLRIMRDWADGHISTYRRVLRRAR